jgi:hypothetical protein
MRTLILAAAFVAAFFATAAVAQLRSLPADAAVAQMSHVSENIVEVKGEQVRLSPGAQIRDAMNRIIFPSMLPPNSVVKYQRDATGQVHRVWILTQQEAEAER